MTHHIHTSEIMLDSGIEKVAGPALDQALKAIKNVPTLGGAGAGAVYGGVKGYQGAGEGQGASGALGGAVVGGVAGGFLGGGLRNIYKNTGAGYSQWRKGHKGLSKELEAAGIKGKDADAFSWKNIKQRIPFTEKTPKSRYGYTDAKGKEYERLTEHMGAGKRGKELMDADAKALSQVGSYGDIVAGRRRMVGSLLGGGAAAGYGGYQLKSTGSIAKQTDEERELSRYGKSVDNYAAARKAAERQLSKHTSTRSGMAGTAIQRAVGN